MDYDFGKYQQADLSMTGCGLDDHYRRINEQMDAMTFLSTSGYFYEVDLPEVIALRKRLLPAEENQTYLAASMFGEQWLIRILNDISQLTAFAAKPISQCW